MRIKKKRRTIKQSFAMILSVMMMFMCMQVYTTQAYATLPALQEVTLAQYYGRNVLSNMDNGENLVYVYDCIREGIENLDTVISLNDGNHSITRDEFEIAYYTYVNDNPQHFWRGNSYSISSMGNKIYQYAPSYNSLANDINISKDKFEDAVSELIKGIDASMSEFERELVIHDRIAEDVIYVLDATNAHNAYGAFVDGEAVCEGYARAFQYALYKVGIVSMTVTGDAGGAHAWNLVKIDNKYYYTDLTWDDGTSTTYHAYFNLPLSEMSKDHTVESNIELPNCDSWDANYFTIFGGKLDEYTVDSVAELLNKNLSADMYLTCDTTDFWTWFKSNISTIVSKCGVTGGFSYGYQKMGNEWIVYIQGANRTDIPVTGVTLDKTTYEFNEVGETFNLKATVSPSNARNKSVTYSTDNKDVAIVDRYTGLVTSMGEGTTNIVATSEDGGKTAVCKVTVKGNGLNASIDVNGVTDTLECKVGEKVTVSVQAEGGSEEYTYKYVIKNVTTGTTATLKNYTTEASYTGTLTSVGTKEFTVYVKDSDGSVVTTNKVTVVVKEALSATLKVNGSSGTIKETLGNKVTLTPAAVGGSGGYTYKYVIENVATGATATLKGYSSSVAYTGTLTSAGTKKFIVYVKDSEGTVVKTNAVTIVVTDTKTLSATLKVNGEESTLKLTTGESVTLVPTTTGGSGSYTYKYVIENIATGAKATLKNYSSATSYTGMLKSAGTKKFTVYVKDSNGTVVMTNSVTVVITDELSATLKVNGNTGSVEATVGSKVMLLPTVTGGSGGYTYKYVIKNVATGATATLKNYSSETSYTGKLTSVGTKDFYVYVRDSEGNVVKTNVVRFVVK